MCAGFLVGFLFVCLPPTRHPPWPTPLSRAGPARPPRPPPPKNPLSTSAFGGGLPAYTLFCLWLTIAFAGLAVQLGGLAALQNYFYKAPGDVAAWTAAAGIAQLSPGDALRWDWWALFFGFMVAVVIAVAACSGGAVVHQARGALLAWAAAAAVVQMISCDRTNALRGSTVGYVKSAARAAFAGVIINIVGLLACTYHLGVSPS